MMIVIIQWSNYLGIIKKDKWDYILQIAEEIIFVNNMLDNISYNYHINRFN